MNNLTVSGRLGRDAEQRTIPSGTTLLSFPLAVDVGYGDNKTTAWFRYTVFGKRAEGTLVDYLKKGQQVVVSGEVKLNEYTNSDGENKSSMDVNVQGLDLVGAKPEAEAPAPAPKPAPVATPSFDDDVPF